MVVKSSTSIHGGRLMSHQEWEAAREHRSDYLLAMVTLERRESGKCGAKVAWIRDPYGKSERGHIKLGIAGWEKSTEGVDVIFGGGVQGPSA